MLGITAQDAFNRLDSITTKEELLSFPRSQRPRFLGPKLQLGNAYKN